MPDNDPTENSDFELFEEAGGSEPAGAPAPAPAGKPNRPFLMTIGIIGGLFLIGLIALGVYGLVILPQRNAIRQSQIAEALARNTATALAATESSAAFLSTQEAAKAPLPTSTLRPPTVAVPTSTVAPTSVLAQASPTPGISGATLSAPQMTATMAVLKTQLAQAATGTPRATSLPTTGFADEAGLPGLIGLAAVFVVVILVARRLRSHR